VGIAIPIYHWRDCEREVDRIRQKFDLENGEIHTAWLLRSYREQSKIPDFELLKRDEREQKMQAVRNAELLRLQRGPKKAYKQAKKNFAPEHSRHNAALNPN